MLNKKEVLGEIVRSIFSLSDDSFAILNQDGDIMESNSSFNKLLLIPNPSEKNNIRNYIKDFTFDNIKDVYSINDIEVDIKVQ